MSSAAALCWAKGYDDSFIAEMLAHMRTLTPFNEVEMSVCRELFLDYCILGGMPTVVREFITKGTFEGSLGNQRQLIADSGLLVAMLDEEAQEDLRTNKNLGVYTR